MRAKPGLLWVVAAVLAFLASPLSGCGDDTATTDDTVVDDSATDTADATDTTDTTEVVIGDDVYGPVQPDDIVVVPSLSGDWWREHYTEDVLPFWLMDAAKGDPVGNFPTYRRMDGLTTGSGNRRPRMISRQTYGYAAGYLMTGDVRLLELAHAGVSWLRDHAIDRADGKGGCHEQLTASGTAIAGVRTAQDLSYCVMGLAAWYFVTRDADAEADLLAAREALFDPARYWDADNARIRDALQDDMATEVDVEGDGGWELVAQLDPVNAFMLLVQPVLQDAEDRAAWLADLRTLGDTMVAAFYADGIFWGVSNKQGQYRTKHVDFGHTLKSYWMLLQIDKRLPDHPYHDLVMDNVHAMVARAHDDDFDRWAKRPLSETTVEYGSDWWVYAEADQLVATLNMIDDRYRGMLAQTQSHWRSDYVDARFEVGEVIPGIKRDGSPVWPWSADDDAKCNQWKNGFHSTEHALVLSMLGDRLAGDDVVLHFAVPAEIAETFVAKPYLFDGREVGRTLGEPVTVRGLTLVPVAVRFRDLY